VPAFKHSCRVPDRCAGTEGATVETSSPSPLRGGGWGEGFTQAYFGWIAMPNGFGPVGMRLIAVGLSALKTCTWPNGFVA